jgi:hypothetical protein
LTGKRESGALDRKGSVLSRGTEANESRAW